MAYCAIVHNEAHQAGGIKLDQGRLLLAGCLFADNNLHGASDLQASNGSHVTVLSSCPGNSYNAGQGTLKCSGCSTAYPADLLSGECTACPTPAPYSCCGARYEEECTDTISPVCSEDEPSVCSTFPTPQPVVVPSMLPTPLAQPGVPTTASGGFTALVVVASVSAIFIAIIFRWCLAWRIRLDSSRRTRDNEEVIASPIFEASYDSSEYESGAEKIYPGGAREDEDGRTMSESTSSEVATESYEIASTYGADRTLGSTVDDDGGVYADDAAPLEKLISHLCRHGLERKVSETVASISPFHLECKALAILGFSRKQI